MGPLDLFCCCFPKSVGTVPELDIIEIPVRRRKDLLTFKEFVSEIPPTRQPSPILLSSIKKDNAIKPQFGVYINTLIGKK